MKERNVYILLTDTGTLFTKAIKLYTRKPFNHASIAFDDDLMEVYSFGRKQPPNPFVGGFVRENLDDELFSKATCAIYRLTVDAAEYDKMKRYIKQIEGNQENYRYNLLGLFAIPFRIPVTRKNAFFCSQFVASVLIQSGRINFTMPLSLMTPSMVVQDLELVFQGNLQDYRTEESLYSYGEHHNNLGRLPLNLY